MTTALHMLAVVGLLAVVFTVAVVAFVVSSEVGQRRRDNAKADATNHYLASKRGAR